MMRTVPDLDRMLPPPFSIGGLGRVVSRRDSRSVWRLSISVGALSTWRAKIIAFIYLSPASITLHYDRVVWPGFFIFIFIFFSARRVTPLLRTIHTGAICNFGRSVRNCVTVNIQFKHNFQLSDSIGLVCFFFQLRRARKIIKLKISIKNRGFDSLPRS